VPWIVVQAPLVVAAGVELHIITVSKHIAADDEFERDGIHFHFLKIPGVPRAALAYQWDRRRINACLTRIAPDLVQGFGTESSFGYSAVSSRFPSVLMIQGIVARITEARGKSALWRQPQLCIALLFERLTVKRARHVICETRFAADFVHLYNPRAITHILRTPIQDRWFEIARSADTTAAPEVVFVGWVVPAKGVDVLIAAFADVLKTCPRAVLHIVGSYEPAYLQDVLMPAVARVGVTDRVHFHGGQSVSFIADRLARAAVVVLPTRMDTAPNVLAEARAAGVPVVASAVGGIPELIEDDVDGLMVEAGTSAPLAAAVVRVLTDAPLAARLSAHGRERVRREHRLSEQVPKLLEIYRGILAESGARA